MLTEKILVIGGSGFLGFHIIQALDKANIGRIYCGDLKKNFELSCNFLKINILDPIDTKKKLQDYEIIINCIGQITKPFNRCYELNSTGINNIAKALLNTNKRLIHISSVAVYGSANKCNEKSPLNPETNYATAKAFAEKTLLENSIENLIVLRLSNLYGSHQLQGVLSYLLKSYFSDRILKFNNDGSLTRSFMHVEDCANLIVEIVKHRNLKGIFNVKGDETFSLKDLIDEFERKYKLVFQKHFEQVSPLENIKNLDDSSFKSMINYKSQWKLFDFIGEVLEKN